MPQGPGARQPNYRRKIGGQFKIRVVKFLEQIAKETHKQIAHLYVVYSINTTHEWRMDQGSKAKTTYEQGAGRSRSKFTLPYHL